MVLGKGAYSVAAALNGSLYSGELETSTQAQGCCRLIQEGVTPA